MEKMRGKAELSTIEMTTKWTQTWVGWEYKKLIWQQWALGNTIKQTLRYIELNRDKYPNAPADRGTISKVRQELQNLPLGLANELVMEVPEIKEWLERIRTDLTGKLGKESEGTFGAREAKEKLQEHFKRLARIAGILKYHVNRLLRWKGYDDIEMSGNIFRGIKFWRKSNWTIIRESPDPLREFSYEEKHPVDRDLAKCLFSHYEDKFGKLSFKGWDELQIDNVDQRLVENLTLLTDSNVFEFCQDCPFCRELTEDKTTIL